MLGGFVMQMGPLPGEETEVRYHRPRKTPPFRAEI